MHFVTLLRHGESEGNSTGVIQGQSEYPLTQTGITQARKLAVYWNSTHTRFDLIISSPLLRASQTAEIISDCLHVPIEFDPSWKERNFGSLQGTRLKEIDRDIDFFHPYQPIGGSGESQLDLFTRASQALQRLLRQPPGSYLVVSHGGILNKAIFVIMGITPQGHYNSPIFHFGNIGYAQFRYNPDSRQWAVLGLNNQYPHIHEKDLEFWKQD
jgi:broad specificity phosphatase PhoE